MMKKAYRIHVAAIVAVVLIVFFLIFSGCKAKAIYVPVETVKTEYRDTFRRDSVYLHDSVLVKMRGDTVWVEKYKYLYHDKLRTDSVYLSDTIRIPYPVDVEKEVNRLSSFQSFQIWCGRIVLLILLGWFSVKWIRTKL
ncbi:hypothetical protein D0T57_12430 [Dysgonomonas sp. 511]|nr:hypothetical protein [Dysgonomonas sp. 511]